MRRVSLKAGLRDVTGKPGRRRDLHWGLALAGVILSAAQSGLAADPQLVRAGRANDSIHLDGLLDEPVWQQAGVIPDLTQQSPDPGQPTLFRTEVRLVIDEATLYIGFVAFDPEPDKIAVHTMQRDGEMEGDDTVAFVLDTFGDLRTGYLFRVNAAGARQDGLISGSQSLSLDWDGIWDARVRRLPDGWSGEIAVPAQTLRFNQGLASWGFNVERNVARERLQLRWTGLTLDIPFIDLSATGELGGVEDLKQGLGLSVAPYGLARWTHDFTEADHGMQGDGGLDVTYRLTPQLASVLTVNTDFAETEVDTQQINLTRFDLFFPEKRTFFLEGLDQFEFATGLGTDFIPFYSRRVGLVDGVQVPVDVGAKILGRAGRWGIGVVDARTGDSSIAPATNLFASRLTYDAGEQLRLGTIVTHGDPRGAQDNTVAGLDAVWHTSAFRGDKNFTTGVWGARSFGDRVPNQDGSRGGWGFRVDYPNDLWDLSATVNQFDEALDPKLGFVPRPGTRSYQMGAAYQPRPTGSAFSWVRQFFYELNVRRVDDITGFDESLPNANPHCGIESWRVFTAPFNIETQTGEHLEANWTGQVECLREDAVIAGVVIPAGSYRFDRYRVEAQSSRHRSWRVGTTWWFGGFFDGKLSQLRQFAQWSSPASHMQLQIEREADTGHAGGDRIAQRLWQFSAVYAFTPNLIVSSYAQYDADSVGVNSRVRWTIHPGTDVYVVWNRNWRDPIDDDDFRSDALPLQADQLVVKLRWTFTR